MSLTKKVVLSFLITAFIIGLLSLFLYVNFIEIKKETEFLELTDTIRSKSLQLRRHEKNYVLYAPLSAQGEAREIYRYLRELEEILEGLHADKAGRTAALAHLFGDYRKQFGRIELLLADISRETAKLRLSSREYAAVSRLIEGNFLDKPLEDVRYLKEKMHLRDDHRLIYYLKEIDSEINELRKTGEGILNFSKELDRLARVKVDRFVLISRIAIIVLFPVFVIVGFSTSLVLISSIVKRLKSLTDLVEKTGQGHFIHSDGNQQTWGDDEVGILTRKFYFMEDQLEKREKELFESKKLAAIGTLASGVAHELNNPLNNIYTTAQRLMKKSGDEAPLIKKGLNDIFDQTMRVKKIVADLLEFAKGREPSVRPVDLKGLVTGIFRQLSNTMDVTKVRFTHGFRPDEIVIYADMEQLEQVFINLFTNAVEAMPEGGDLDVRAEEQDYHVEIRISDSGQGIPADKLEKIFEPFYTTKGKGTGLGLAIVFNIVRKHHGDIRVESGAGKGTAFIISLPKTVPDTADL